MDSKTYGTERRVYRDLGIVNTISMGKEESKDQPKVYKVLQREE